MIHSSGGGADGESLYPGLIAVKGALYGTTYFCGTYFYGTVFEIKQP